MFLLNIFIYILSFVAIWGGTGLIVSSVDKLSKKLRVSSFAISFFVLGLLTSVPEFAIGLAATSKGTPDIFVGNLIGGIVVIFFLVIPLLAVFGNGIKLNSLLSDKKLLLSFGVILAPSLLVIDKSISLWEGIISIGLYFVLFYFIEKAKGVLDDHNSNILHVHSYSFVDILKVLFGVALVLISSGVLVEKTIYFAEFLKISTFYVSLIILSLGTNIPELSLAVRSVLSGKKDIALGDYIGSAVANTLLFGVFTILNSGQVVRVNGFIHTFLIIALGLGIFYYFTRSKHDISRKEGLIILCFYLVFVAVEVALR